MTDADTTEPTEAVEVYWRPGCGFCMALDRNLTQLGIPMVKHNIWEDPEAAGFVRSVAGGNETVPTVVVGDRAMVNPGPDQVVAALAEVAPDLVPEGYEPRQPGRVGRAVLRALGQD